jgi:drug/metabolite transporter (DMT)-like permease
VAGVALALTTALLFGASFVFVRLALARAPSPEEGGVVIDAVACLVAVGVVLLSGTGFGHVPASALPPLIAAGVLAPGISQTLLVKSVAASGAARTAQIAGATPLASAALAMLFLGEPLSIPFLVGTVVIVCGVVIQSSEAQRPTELRVGGLLFAAAAVLAFAGRDNLVRSGVHVNSDAPALPAAAIILAAATVTTLLVALAAHGPQTFPLLKRGVVPFLASGVMTGIAYICLAGAFSRLRVTVVSPLIATQTLWAVLLAGVVLGRREALGRTAAVASVLIVAGAALVGATRA